MFQIEWSDRALRQLDKLARRNPEISHDIFEKVEWLAGTRKILTMNNCAGDLNRVYIPGNIEFHT